jgi:uncharacterized membrane protein YdjX (TVP38/TMEM64 family)
MSENPEPPSRLLRNILLLLIPAALSAGTVLLLWQSHPELSYWKSVLEDIHIYLEANPWALVFVLATLPGLGLPISPVLVLFGIVMGPLYGLPMACAIGIAAQSICTIWTYALAAGPLRGLLTGYVLRKRELPQLTEQNALRLGFIMRITPGIPYALQNVVLGIMGLRFKPYLLVSIPITSLWTIGFIFTGGAIFEGRAGLAITSGLILVILILITRMLRGRTQKYAG